MNLISMIAAVADNRVIGNGPNIPWHISNDLKRFRKITEGNSVIMGRKTFESIGKILPDRQNIIITSDLDFKVDKADVVHSIEDSLKIAKYPIYVAGGGQIYDQFMPLCHKLYITQVHQSPPGDVYFPYYDNSEWTDIEYIELGTHSYLTMLRN